jgi:hypothetical protein
MSQVASLAHVKPVAQQMHALQVPRAGLTPGMYRVARTLCDPAACSDRGLQQATANGMGSMPAHHRRTKSNRRKVKHSKSQQQKAPLCLTPLDALEQTARDACVLLELQEARAHDNRQAAAQRRAWAADLAFGRGKAAGDPRSVCAGTARLLRLLADSKEKAAANRAGNFSRKSSSNSGRLTHGADVTVSGDATSCVQAEGVCTAASVPEEEGPAPSATSADGTKNHGRVEDNTCTAL